MSLLKTVSVKDNINGIYSSKQNTLVIGKHLVVVMTEVKIALQSYINLLGIKKFIHFLSIRESIHDFF